MLSTLKLLNFGCRISNSSPAYVSKSFLKPGLLLTNFKCSDIPANQTFVTGSKKLLKRPQKIGRANTPNNYTTRNFGCLVKPFIFTISVGCVSYVAAAIWQYEELKKIVKKNRYNWGVGGFGEMRRLNSMDSWWNGYNPGMKVVLSIIALNSAVFLLWKVPALNRVMMTYFTGNPMGAAPCTSLILSSFSHVSPLHIFANMYVLWSFAPAITSLLGPEQFAATYLTAAAVSGFGSYVHKVIICSKVPSLGASGAICAVLGMVCLKYPDARLSIAFVDQIFPHSFSAETAMKGLILLDTAGLLLGWKLFDHAAHLSGIVFGLWYVTYGQKFIWQNRDYIVKKWRSLRRKSSGD